MRRTTIVITSALAFSLLLSGCGAGQNAATRKITRVTDGTEITVRENGSEIRVVNLTLVDTEDGAAVVVATIVNQGTRRRPLAQEQTTERRQHAGAKIAQHVAHATRKRGLTALDHETHAIQIG